jgi:polyisoprenoid-binding protein YceI
MKRALLIAVLLAGCAAAPPREQLALPAPDNAASWYQQAEAAGAKVLVVDPAQSLITVTVRRGGPMAQLGHDHVVASRGVTGFAAPAEGRADFSFRLDQMTVDEPALRTEAHLDTQPSAEAVAGTRSNMLTRVLEADRFPVVVLHARLIAGSSPAFRLAITLHGVTRELIVPASVVDTADGVTASGALTLVQSDFGITPMSILGGAITVQDPMELRFRIVARAKR